MEVHHHPDLQHRKKNFKEYFLEFLMIFLAVTLGFIAENIREHVIEMTTEHEYVKSFYEDLTADESDLQKSVNYLDQQARIADSLSILMNNISTAQPANFIYIYLRSITRSPLFTVNDRTIIQLRNAGGMRLIRNKNVSDSMVAYYKEVDHLKFLFDESLTIKRSQREKYEPLLNATEFSKRKSTTETMEVHHNPELQHKKKNFKEYFLEFLPWGNDGIINTGSGLSLAICAYIQKLHIVKYLK